MEREWIVREEWPTSWDMVPKDSPNMKAWIQAERDLDEAFLHSIGWGVGSPSGGQ